jgi:iron complex outermembrane receptor protein
MRSWALYGTCAIGLVQGLAAAPAFAQDVPGSVAAQPGTAAPGTTQPTDPAQPADERSGGGAAVAATAETSQPAADDNTDIVVTGIRRSLQQAATIKRDAPQVLDVITAEDVGKLPDANVAEALQRVTGVQITRVFGEGQAVTVRGLQQVRVEVDGRTLLAFSARLSPPENEQLGRSSGLDSVPSSVFGRLEVRKSPLASQVEGGLSG